MATKTGESDWMVVLSTAKTGSTGSETPDGDIYYFFADSVDGNIDSLDKFNHASTFTIRYPTNKRKISVKIGSAKVPPIQEGSSTEELNVILNFMYNYSIKTGANKCYMFLKHTSENKYVKLSWDDSDNHVQYLKGQLKNIKYSLIGGEYIWQIDFTFIEATQP